MVNKVTLIGRLGKDPEVRTLDNGTFVARISIATDESYKDRQGVWQTLTEWHNVILWRDAAQRAERTLRKGYLVYLEGKLTYRSWKDDQGNTNNITEIKTNFFRILQKGTQPASTTETTATVAPSTATTTDNDLPF